MQRPEPARVDERGRDTPRTGRQPVSHGVDALRLPLVAECNLACGLCTTPEDAGLDADDVSALLAGALRGGRHAVLFTGGEPTLVDALPTYVAEAAERGFTKIGLETNALRCAYPGYADELKAAGLTFAKVHLPASTPAHYDAWVGRAGLFAPALKGIRALVAAGLRTELNVPLTAASAEHLEALLAMVAAHLPGVAMVRVEVAEGPERIANPSVLRERLAAVRKRADALALPLSLSGELQAAEPSRANVNRQLTLSSEGFYPDPATGELRHEIDLRITLECNQYCHFCLVGDRDNDRVSRAVHAQLETLAPRFESGELHRLTITGGEPTLVRELPDYVRHARKLGIGPINLQTNAMRLASRPYAERLRDAGLSSLFVSLHAADAETSDAITVCPGGFERTLRGLDVALELGFETRLNCVINSMNAASLPAYVRFVVERFRAGRENPAEITFSYVGTMGDAMRNPWIVPAIEEVRPQIEAALAWLADEGVPHTGLTGNCGIPPCFLGGEPRFLTDLREVQPEERTGSHVYLPACEPCHLRASCFGVRREYLELHGEQAVQPVRAAAS